MFLADFASRDERHEYSKDDDEWSAAIQRHYERPFPRRRNARDWLQRGKLAFMVLKNLRGKLAFVVHKNLPTAW